MLWKAHTDIQFVGESTLAIAEYATGYMTKAEKGNMQNIWQSHQSVCSKLWSFGVRSLQSRKCGLYKASRLLLGGHLCGKSQTVKWVDVSQPKKQEARAEGSLETCSNQRAGSNSTDIFEANPIDTFYPE